MYVYFFNMVIISEWNNIYYVRSFFILMLRSAVNITYTWFSTINLYFKRFVKAHTRSQPASDLPLFQARSHLQVETSRMRECQQGYDAHIRAIVSNFDYDWLGQP